MASFGNLHEGFTCSREIDMILDYLLGVSPYAARFLLRRGQDIWRQMRGDLQVIAW